MTTEEREMILNLTYLELAEKFRNEPQVLIKFLREEQKKDDKLKSIRIIDKLISLIMIIIEDYYLEEIKYDEGMEKFNRFFIKCIAYKVYTKEKKSFYSRIFFDGISGVTKIKDDLYIYDVDEILEQGKCCSGCNK